MSEHPPEKWKIVLGRWQFPQIVDHNGRAVVSFAERIRWQTQDVIYADAARIVTAVNSFEALVGACEAALHQIEPDTVLSKEADTIANQLASALKLARETT